MSLILRSQLNSASVVHGSSYDDNNEVNLATKSQENDGGENELLSTNVIDPRDDNKEIEETANQPENDEISCKTVCKLV